MRQHGAALAQPSRTAIGDRGRRHRATVRSIHRRGGSAHQLIRRPEDVESTVEAERCPLDDGRDDEPFERLPDRRGSANVFDFLRHQFRVRPVRQDKTEPAQIVRARFTIDRDMIDVA